MKKILIGIVLLLSLLLIGCEDALDYSDLANNQAEKKAPQIGGPIPAECDLAQGSGVAADCTKYCKANTTDAYCSLKLTPCNPTASLEDCRKTCTAAVSPTVCKSFCQAAGFDRYGQPMHYICPEKK